MKCVLNAMFYASEPLLLLASFTCVLASTAHLYMPQLFTHCLPIIICVTLMYIVYVLSYVVTMVLHNGPWVIALVLHDLCG